MVRVWALGAELQVWALERLMDLVLEHHLHVMADPKARVRTAGGEKAAARITVLSAVAYYLEEGSPVPSLLGIPLRLRLSKRGEDLGLVVPQHELPGQAGDLRLDARAEEPARPAGGLDDPLPGVGLDAGGVQTSIQIGLPFRPRHVPDDGRLPGDGQDRDFCVHKTSSPLHRIPSVCACQAIFSSSNTVPQGLEPCDADATRNVPDSREWSTRTVSPCHIHGAKTTGSRQ